MRRPTPLPGVESEVRAFRHGVYFALAAFCVFAALLVVSSGVVAAVTCSGPWHYSADNGWQGDGSSGAACVAFATDRNADASANSATVVLSCSESGDGATGVATFSGGIVGTYTYAMTCPSGASGGGASAPSGSASYVPFTGAEVQSPLSADDANAIVLAAYFALSIVILSFLRF